MSTQKDSCLLFGIINVTDAFDNTPNVFYTILKFHLWSILNNKRFRGPTTDPQKSNQIIIHAKYIEKLHRAYYLYEAQLSPKWSDFCICRYTRSRVTSFFNRNWINFLTKLMKSHHERYTKNDVILCHIRTTCKLRGIHTENNFKICISHPQKIFKF